MGDVRKSVSTVFISSRMEEACVERKAAFEAVFACRFVPMMFEASPELGSRGDRDRINNLIDNSDLFFGIYDRSLGDPGSKVEYFDLCPLEYELARFVFTAYHRRQKMKAAHRRDDVTRWLQNPTELAELRKGLQGKYKDELRSRVRLLVKSGGVMDKELAAFLKPFPTIEIKPEELRADAKAESSQFTAIHIAMHKKICGDIDLELKKTFDVPPEPQHGVWVRAILRDQPGSLAPYLEVLYGRGLNICHFRHEPRGQGRAEITVWCRQTKANAAPWSSAHGADLKNALSSDDVQSVESQRVAGLNAAVQKAIKEQQKVLPRHGDPSHVLRIRTLRAPGILSMVTSRLRRRCADITLARHEATSNHEIVPQQQFDLYFRFSAELKRTGEVQGHLFGLNYEIQGIPGVVSGYIEKVAHAGKRLKQRKGRDRSEGAD
jgi:hypothetical protein